MKKIIILILIFITTILSAKITEEQRDNYLKVSKAGEFLKYSNSQSKKQLATLLISKNTKANVLMKKIFEDFVTNPKRQNLYKDLFLDLNISDYNKMISFYGTKVGMKYARATRLLKDNMTYDEISTEYQRLKSNNILSYEKEILLANIAKEFNLIDLKVKLKEDVYLFQQFLEDNKKVEIEKNKKRRLLFFKNETENYQTKFMGVLYKNFSHSELIKVLNYASTKEGKTEQLYIFKGLTKLTHEHMIGIKKNLKKWGEIYLCQDYTLESKWYPPNCKNYLGE